MESLESVFDELYEDRRSGDARGGGIEDDRAGVRGVSTPGGGGWIPLVSRVREEVATFLDDWLLRNMDFHADWPLGEVGDRGWTGRGA